MEANEESDEDCSLQMSWYSNLFYCYLCENILNEIEQRWRFVQVGVNRNNETKHSFVLASI